MDTDIVHSHSQTRNQQEVTRPMSETQTDALRELLEELRGRIEEWGVSAGDSDLDDLTRRGIKAVRDVYTSRASALQSALAELEQLRAERDSIQARERERCAKIADECADSWETREADMKPGVARERVASMALEGRSIAFAIRESTK